MTAAKPGQLPPPGHQFVETGDGSFTLFSEKFAENCHSIAGAKEETLTHYLQGCQVEELLKTQSQVRILEVGFATGLGWRMTQELALKYPSAQLDFVSLELDEALIQWADPALQKHTAGELTWFEKQVGNARLRVLCGDARQTLPRFSSPAFHAIYQDAFSPKKNPTLWTVEWFTLLGSLAEPGAWMSTYSASVSIRKAMVAAGWGVLPGEKFGPKRTSTRARWQHPSDPFILEALDRSPTPALKDNV